MRCELMREGVLRDTVSIPLASNGQEAQFIEEMFTAADTSDFAGSVHCDAVGNGRFTAVALELDAVNRVFTTLPVSPVRRGGGRGGGAELRAFRQWGGHHLRSGVRESIPPSGAVPRPPPFIRTSFRPGPLFTSTTPRASRLPPNRWWTSPAIWRSRRTAA